MPLSQDRQLGYCSMMHSPAPAPASRPWLSFGIVALLSLLAQLALCQFFSLGASVPASIDINPSNLWKNGYQWPPTGQYLTLNWLGVSVLPPPLNPFTLATHLPAWWFFTTYAPLASTAALLMMAAFLREFELPRPAALFGGLVYAWQGDLLPFVFPGHFAYITTWFFFAAAAWGALRAERTGNWAYALVSGVSCGTMIGLAPDRGVLASLLIAALFLVPAGRDFQPTVLLRCARRLAICGAVALLVSLGSLLAIFQSNVVGVKMGGEESPAQVYRLVTQFSLGPAETLSYLVPGFFGWHSSSESGPYWGWIGESLDYPKNHQGSANLNLAISTTGTVATLLALLAIFLLLFWSRGLSPRQAAYGRWILALGAIALVLSWGWHTPLYAVLYHLPLMDKWRNPLKWLEITNFALVTLSALGLQHLLETLGTDPLAATVRRRVGWLLGAAAFLIGIGWTASLTLGFSLIDALRAESFDPTTLPSVATTLHLSLAVALGLLLAFGLLLFAVWQPAWLRTLQVVNPWLNRAWQKIWQPEHLPLTLALTLAALSTAQLAWVAIHFVTPVDLGWLTGTNGLVDALKKEGPAVRVSTNPQDPVLNALMQNQFQADRVSCLEVSAASRVPDIYSAFLKTFQKDPVRLYFLAGVKNLALPQEMVPQLKATPGLVDQIAAADGYQLAPTDSPDLPSHALIQLRDYLAKATLVPAVEIIADPAAMLQRMQDLKWNPRQSLLLDRPPPAAVSPNLTEGPSRVVLTAYTMKEIDFDVQSPAPAFVLINDQFDPDWRVEVDGHSAPLLRADYFFRAVPVPAGASHVTMRFSARYRIFGLDLPTELASAFSDGSMIAAWIVAGIVLIRGRKK